MSSPETIEPCRLMTTESDSDGYALQIFQPDPDALYPVDVAARLAQMPRHIVLVCYRRGLVSPRVDPAFGGILFDLEAVRTLQRIEYLRSACGVNLAGIQIILHLMQDVEKLRGRADETQA
jgi:DNA-binding transcriptional MerR regulator